MNGKKDNAYTTAPYLLHLMVDIYQSYQEICQLDDNITTGAWEEEYNSEREKEKIERKEE